MRLTAASMITRRSMFSTVKAVSESFKLCRTFVDRYASVKPPFGYNGLGELVYLRTYSRNKSDGKERWHETVERVVNGTYQMQQDWLVSIGMPWSTEQRDKIQLESQEMYDRIFNMKMLPPGRGLWAMGSPLTTERKLYAALNNCAFVSTEDLNLDSTGPFTFLMDASMLGVGVGFDTKGAGKVMICSTTESTTGSTFVVPDTREGWVDSLRLLLSAFIAIDKTETHKVLPNFDYSKIRAAGVPIKGFGGVSQGPDILMELHTSLINSLKPCAGQLISITNIVDIMNIIGKCVVAGNVRRTAEIAFGSPYSDEYISLKDYSINPHRAAYAWTSNNSVFADIGMDYGPTAAKVQLNGEPGFAWLENMRAFGRMGDPANYKDHRARGGNPCLEQTLESYEICCLVETFPDKHETLDDFKKTLNLAVTYAKTVTLGSTHWPQTNNVMLRNRRIGTSLSGIAQFISSRGIEKLKDWCEAGYQQVQESDERLSGLFGIPKSIKTTCIKPSGTVSLLAGATAGMHFPESRFYIRRVRLAVTSELLVPLKAAGYILEPCVGDDQTTVVSIPIDVGKHVRTVGDVSMWEQLSLAAFLQKYWADNQVSCTVTFDPMKEGNEIKNALNYFQYNLKGISFLPRLAKGAYPQMPYEEITEEQYNVLASKLNRHMIDISEAVQLKPDDINNVPDKFCDAAGCAVGGPEQSVL